MLNVKITQATSTSSSSSFATCAGNALPPNNFVDALLGSLFPENESNRDLFAPFDYEEYLRKEGLA